MPCVAWPGSVIKSAHPRPALPSEEQADDAAAPSTLAILLREKSELSPNFQHHPPIKGGGGEALGPFCAIACARGGRPTPFLPCATQNLGSPHLVQFKVVEYGQIRDKKASVFVRCLFSGFQDKTSAIDLSQCIQV